MQTLNTVRERWAGFRDCHAPMTILLTHRPRGSNWDGGGCGRGLPSPTRSFGGITPGKFWKFYVQNGALVDQIALSFDSKQTANLTQTYGHKWFSEVAQ